MSKKRQEGLFKGESLEWSLSCFVDILEEEKKQTSGKTFSVLYLDHVHCPGMYELDSFSFSNFEIFCGLTVYFLHCGFSVQPERILWLSSNP